MRTALKRVTVLLAELILEAAGLGMLFGVIFGLLTESTATHASPLGGLVISAFLFVYGYYLTRGICGIFWRPPKLYPAIASVLFLFHMHAAYEDLKLTPEGKQTELPFLAGGACIVFACALGGNWLLRKWIRENRSGSQLPVTPATPA